MNPKTYQSYLSQLQDFGMDEKSLSIYQKRAKWIVKNQMKRSAPLTEFSLTEFFTIQIVLDPESDLTLPQQWGIACGADLAFQNRESLNSLKERQDSDEECETLREWWGITNKKQFLETIQQLLSRDEQTYYESIQRDIIWDSNEETELNLSKQFLDSTDLKRASLVASRIQRAYQMFAQEGLTIDMPFPNLAAWDLCRVINLCRWGFSAKYISIDNAMKYIMDAARKLQAKYHSWNELSTAFRLGRYIIYSEDAYDDFYEGTQILLTDPNSPWVKLDWNLHLDER